MSIASEITRIQNAKTDIKTAIENKGVTVPSASTLDDYADYIDSIQTGGSANIQPLSITANGTYTASGGVNGYSPVTVNVPDGSSWVRPSDWPDLSKMNVSGGNILYMTSYADEARGFCSFTVTCTGSYTVEVGTISGSTFTAESTQTFTSGSQCRLYYGSANGIYKVLRVTGTAIKTFTAAGSSAVTIGTFYGYERNQGIIDIIGKLPSCTSFKCSMNNLISVEVDSLILSGDMSNMFSSCYSLINLDVSNWNTSSVTNMYRMFYYCTSLISLDVSGWDTSSVTNMSSMFYYCTSLTNLDVSSWNTSAVTNMGIMFYDCTSLISLDVSNWDTSAVTEMVNMFGQCHSLISLDVSNWDTSAVTIMNNIFNSCYSLTSLDISNWDTSSVTNMNQMFQNCYSIISLDVSNWNTSSVTSMNSMFNACYSLTTLDVSNWNISSVTSMSSMFYYCYSLKNLDISRWNFSSITETSSTNSMFNTCYGLHGSLTLPSSLTFIGASCFSTCRSLYEWHFLATTPPTLANTNAFNNMLDFGGKKIYVPTASLTAYKEATNWSTYASYMVGE